MFILFTAKFRSHEFRDLPPPRTSALKRGEPLSTAKIRPIISVYGKRCNIGYKFISTTTLGQFQSGLKTTLFRLAMEHDWALS